MKSKSQISMEFLMAVGLLSIIFIASLVINNERRQGMDDYKEMMELKVPCDKISSLISDVHSMGHGASISTSLKYNMTLLGMSRQILIWKTDDENRNKTYYCYYTPFNVTNAYNTSFTIPAFTDFTVANFMGNVEIYENSLMDGLVLWVRMDEYNQLKSIYDWSDERHEVEIHGADCSVKGFRGNACEFDGVDGGGSAVSIPEISLNKFSVSFWVKPLSGLYRGVVGQSSPSSGNYYVGFRSDGRFDVRFSSSSYAFISNSGLIPTEEWSYLTYTHDGINTRIFMNSTEINSLNFPTTDATGQTIYFDALGRGYFGWVYNGTIDDVRIYNRALSSEEVKKLYNSYMNWVDLNEGKFPK